MPAPTFLFLQGLPGPSSRRIAGELTRRGARVVRVNVNGGDLFDWCFGGTSFRGELEQFGPWLDVLYRREGVTALVLFGADRAYHRAAIETARQLGIDVFVLEEGYLRPNSVTLEHWPEGQAWPWPECLEDCRRRVGPAAAETPIPGYFFPRMMQGIGYAWFSFMLGLFYPHFRSHRPHHSFFEFLAWNRRWSRAWSERRKSKRALAAAAGQRFFLLPLQIDGDASLVHRSRFAGMAEAIAEVVADFKAHAPAGTMLLVKLHPLDPDLANWRQATMRIAGYDPRVQFIEHGDLDLLLEACAGVVTVNSTVGSLALAKGRPVHAMGRALYAIEGLADPGPLARFWHDPRPPQPGAYDLFARALWSECLINAGFHSRAGLARLIPLAAMRMLEKSA